jgi:hypothetical protein
MKNKAASTPIAAGITRLRQSMTHRLSAKESSTTESKQNRPEACKEPEHQTKTGPNAHQRNDGLRISEDHRVPT